METKSTATQAFTARLGHDFHASELLNRALTHSSARVEQPGSADNDLLEFLGDRVLGLVVAEFLTERFPEADTGEIARRYNKLVRKETCADIARTLEMGQVIIMSDGEADSGGRDKLTILGDACEAVLGAVFLDGGYQSARAVVRTHWLPLLDEADEVLRDAKSALQEWAQGRGLDLPQYAETDRKGPDHAPHFTAKVEIEGLDPQEGGGASKRAAEQAAATAMLEREGIWKPQTDD